MQQSVPAWLIFSMFFILIPISNTFINEKSFGTIQRIKSINVPLYLILLGKILPYFIINQIQIILMFLVGIFIVPLFGGDKLDIQGNLFLLILISFIVSFAAISFALLIANISKTTEEATSIGGVINIIFAAIAGIMVPKFVMPQFMQDLSIFSPMSWGLESFLEVLVRAGNFNDIRLYLCYLLIFGTICLIFANLLLKKREF
ncbi:ABC superfamily ATP binding cassette transporter [Aliarcobacter butzleri JV22]|uniref:ABC transporter permease n=1 Tax=Aliarcobacter butzleri TaxID=28197 RepID=UPI0001F0F4FB|nr:ABC transporter permease [Aliarcobacter butzleri]EFU70998.1 ABC superfamily ATP binding cassette transporter [Aliarcobacter butzleri JV22]